MKPINSQPRLMLLISFGLLLLLACQCTGPYGTGPLAPTNTPEGFVLTKTAEPTKQPCLYEMSVMPPTTKIEPQADGTTKVTVPFMEIAAEWYTLLVNRVEGIEMVADGDNIVFTFPANYKVSTEAENIFIEEEGCEDAFFLQALTTPSMQQNVLNTGALPTGGGVGWANDGLNPYLILPPGPVQDYWNTLFVDGDERMRMDSMPDGGAKIHFPLGSSTTTEGNDDGSWDITIADGLPPSIEEIAGWLQVDTCTLQLGPMPSGSSMSSSSDGTFSISIPDGEEGSPEAIWVGQAAQDERITVTETNNAKVILDFSYQATIVETDTPGVWEVTFNNCQP